MIPLPRRIYRDGPHGPVIAGVDLTPEGDRRAGPETDDRTAGPRQTAAAKGRTVKGRSTKKPPASKSEADGG